MRVYDLEQIISQNVYNWIFKGKEFSGYMERNKIYHQFDFKYNNKHKQDYLNFYKKDKTDYWARYIPTFKRYLSLYQYVKGKDDKTI
jgi:hypothetical protein